MDNSQKINWEMIAAIATAFTALFALFFSLWQGRVTRHHNKMSVKPHLCTWNNDNTNEKGEYETYQLHLINNGIGPAIIKKFLIKVDKEIIKGDPTELIRIAFEKALKPYYLKNLKKSQHCPVRKLRSTMHQEKREKNNILRRYFT